MAEERSTAAMVRGVAAFGLGRATPTTGPVSISPATWRRFLEVVLRQRLSGLAVAAAESGRLVLREEQWLQLVGGHREAMLLCLALERELLGLGQVLDAAGVPFVVLKGPAMANSIYPDPSWRPFGDLDLLVRTQDWQRACEGLATRGSRRRFAEPRIGFTERFGKGALHVDAKGLHIDLHRMLAEGPFGYRMDAERLFEATAGFKVGGVMFRRLDHNGMLLHACLHAVLGHTPPLLLPLRDVIEAARSPDVDWRMMSDWVTRWRLRAVVRRALELAGSTLNAQMPAAAVSVGRSLVPDREETRTLNAFLRGLGRRGAREVSSLRAIPGLREKIAFASALLMPDPEFVMAREGGPARSAYLRRLKVPIQLAFKR